MKKLILLSLLLATALLPACNQNKPAGKPSAAGTSAAVEGAAAPDFTVKDLAGKEVQLSSLKGQVVFVNFWATWCPPCLEEIPSLMQLNQKMTGKPFRMLAISIDEGGREAVEGLFRKSGFNLPAYLDGDGSIARRYGTTGVPESFIVDKNGVIQKKIIGGLNWGSADVINYLNELAAK